MESNPTAAADAAAAASHGVLPLDVVFDILVRLPAKEILRFGAVCRPWRVLTTDPLFIQAHAARHPGPLIVATFKGNSEPVYLMDLSGNVVKRLRIAKGRTCLCSGLDLICAVDTDGGCTLMNPAAGTVSHLPSPRSSAYCVFALGRVESTGEYKVLRMASSWEETPYDFDDTSCLVCSVLTINAPCPTRWRTTASPELLPVDMDSGVVVGGSVYYLWSDEEAAQYEKERMWGIWEYDTDKQPDFIACFDLATEQWTTIPGPRPTKDDDGSSDDGSSDEGEEEMEYDDMWSGSTLAELNGNLVLVHERDYSRCFDLWFLTDAKNQVWAKQYSIRAPKSVIPANEMIKPLLLLNDGRIAIFLHHKGMLLLYDPTTNMFSKVHTRCLGAVGLYTGSLLNSQNIAKVSQ